ncbi:MAG: hypothetical protein AAGK05_03985 [Pseudomonadota bacterium]
MTKFKGVSQIERKGRRFIESCFRVLQCRGEQLPSDFETPVKGANIIEQLIASKKATFEEKDKMIQSLIAEAEQSLLSLNEFDWIKDNERACYFLWASIYFNSYAISPDSPWASQTQEYEPRYVHFYSYHNLKSNPSNTAERYDEVVKYFDRVQQPIDWKLNLLSHLKNIWARIFTSRKPFTWLERDNEEQCRWAWDYLRKIKYDYTRPMIDKLSPTNTAEIYLAIYGVYDIWNVAPDTKRLFSIDFNKAWQQKKLRDGRQGKKACSLVLHKDTKLKLDELAKTRKVTLSQLVEQLIEQEYRLKDS